MEKKYLIVNRGSASEKYAVYTKEKCLAFLHVEEAENDTCDYVSTLFIDGKKEVKCITRKEFENSLNYTLDLFIQRGIIFSKEDIVGLGIRIVAPGKYFQVDKIIDEVYEKEIKRVIEDAPLHILPTFEMVQILKKTFRGVPIVGVSDSDFHRTLPDKVKYYALPFEDTRKYNIQKYGYHGISMESILDKLKGEAGQIPEKLLICHLGSGASITAIKDGESVENTMGFTPLEGIMMATRAGDIDPGTIAFLSEKTVLRGKKLKEYLNKRCGLLGVSGKSSDVRDLIKLEKEGDIQAKLALDMYVYRIQKYIGAYFVALGGLDTLIFTATVGERSFIMRERICQGLSVLGVKINKDKNNQSEGIDADITDYNSKVYPNSEAGRVKVLVRRTDEMGQIAHDTMMVLNS